MNEFLTVIGAAGVILQYVGSIWMMVVGWRYWSVFVLTFAFPPMAVIYGLLHLDTARAPLVAIAIGWLFMAVAFVLLK